MSRARAEEAVRAGRVTLRGKVVMDPERRCLPGRDDIRVDGRPVRAARKLYFALHKPVGCITTASDPEGRPTAYDYLPETRENLQAVGRLDADSSGLLLFTNDTEFAARITQAGGIEKVYRGRVRGRVEPVTARRFESGIEIEGALTLPARCSILEAAEGSTLVEITIREGRNRQIRKMWEALGHPVLELHRTRIGPIVLGSLPPGRARALSEAERALLDAQACHEK
jgi:23S rRNA pseudouridine2605 synthase